MLIAEPITTTRETETSYWLSLGRSGIQGGLPTPGATAEIILWFRNVSERRRCGAECGGSAQGIVGESPPASRPCEEGPVQALELHPSARPPTSGQERAHPALSSERTNKAAQLNVNNMFAQSLRWNAHAGLTQLGSGRAVERGLRVRERRAGGPPHTRPRSWGRPRAGA